MTTAFRLLMLFATIATAVSGWADSQPFMYWFSGFFAAMFVLEWLEDFE